MSLDIRELHIRVNVNQPNQSEGQKNAAMSPQEAKKNEDQKEAVISQCIDEVMDIINRKKER